MRKKLILPMAWMLMLCTSAVAQGNLGKPALDLDTRYVSWEKVVDRNIVLSHNGKYCVYRIDGGTQGTSKAIVQGTAEQWEVTIEGGEEYKVSDDDKFVYLLTGKRLCIFEVATRRKSYLENIVSFHVGKVVGKNGLICLQAGNKMLVGVPGDLRAVTGVERYYYTDNNRHLLYSMGDKCFVVDLEKNVPVQLKSITNIDTYCEYGDRIVFSYADDEGRNRLGFYNGGSEVIPLVDQQKLFPLGNVKFTGSRFQFSRDGERVFFFYDTADTAKHVEANPSDAKVYASLTYAETQDPDQLKIATVELKTGKIIPLCSNFVMEGFSSKVVSDSLLLFYKRKYNNRLPWWDEKANEHNISLISLKNGVSHQIANVNLGLVCRFSPDGKYVIYYDRGKRSYMSYSINDHRTVNLSALVAYPTFEEAWSNADAPSDGYGIQGFTGSDEILLADRYDIWKVKLNGTKVGTALTGGEGRRKKISLRIVNFDREQTGMFRPDQTMLLSALDENTKDQGFYKCQLKDVPSLIKLTMGPDFLLSGDSYRQSFVGPIPSAFSIGPIKAKKDNAYLILKSEKNASPNLFFTRDFKAFRRLTSVYPERRYSWFNSSLLNYTVNGKPSKAIVYKPENFDPNLKYPVIFYYYEHISDFKNQFLFPDLSGGPLAIPYFVSNGYIVCVPDIQYKIGYPGKSALACILGAASELKKLDCVDSTRLGLQGHSFGGYETNYVISHSNQFKAAVSAAGVSDLIAKTYGFNNANGTFHTEQGQGRIGVPLWENPALYIQNSPIYAADSIRTPVLIQVGSLDSSVPSTQGRELFSVLKRLGRQAWLIDYPRAGHILTNESSNDYTVRIKQFFDHYLKDKPLPKWMSLGISGQEGLQLEAKEINKQNK
ncbi:alpha/beta hydrolase family protein [Pedobacter sp. KBW01]|uniref:alpha/beta hydrolase family protein n=1 Tax=Pedobacter sp. KBW01 TaxID=2153364 RepID=UPI00131A0569|nr:prolyl oligopeptidase family serine peptidase [Pedobacter sp. KBW01]